MSAGDSGELEGYRPELEEWRQPIAWKAFMAALMTAIVDLDLMPPQDRTTAGFLHQLTIRLGQADYLNIPALTLENEQQAQRLVETLQWNVALLQEKRHRRGDP